ncbi:GMC family oxidoreductase [Streptomyces endophyticus]|uniref:GMC family oxidoreductase N-terminal domain-containing protein n=1 Tax=Streptomyces endophyticus TaxID=714166 RepID=A0ABU6F2C5_9ACTN|nr:GMC family oxidoreductase N-terminal domain-containing protein [Streptomyces endophyticus]MEB8336987.1 GMC family oxidoreductase N-terminal domain-containing protein [Streptomyces endophyticus]
MSNEHETVDAIVVGGGSAGAVLAARLSQDPARTVLLLEAGQVYAPDAYPLPLLDADTVADSDHDWGYTSRGTAQSPPLPTPRGKVLGGSSAVNAGVALRARAADFAKWGEHGAEGWTFDDVLPTFKLLESTPTGDDVYHGRSGPLPIRQRADDELTPSLRGFIEASVAQGHKRVLDFNGAEQNGAGGYPVDVVDGVRQNTGLVYLTAEVRRRPNLTIRGEVNVDRVLFEGTLATGVLAADGTVYRGREVILCGGAYGSPAILLRSGVGPSDDLADLGIGVVADLPVGRRLQDQPGYYNAYALAPGHLEMTPAVGSLLWTSSSEAAAGELDLHVTATHLMPGEFSPTGGAIVLMAALALPESAGTVKLAGRDPQDAPLIESNYLGTERDARRMLEAVKLGRAIARDPAFAPFVVQELAPGDAVTDDEALARVIAVNPAIYGHPTSTAPMGGLGDPWAVVDSVGAVKGVSGLRVVDAAIIPEALSSTTNVTVIMLAERIYQRVYAD